jgi:hypothetical protein
MKTRQNKSYDLFKDTGSIVANSWKFVGRSLTCNVSKSGVAFAASSACINSFCFFASPITISLATAGTVLATPVLVASGVGALAEGAYDYAFPEKQNQDAKMSPANSVKK